MIVIITTILEVFLHIGILVYSAIIFISAIFLVVYKYVYCIKPLPSEDESNTVKEHSVKSRTEIFIAIVLSVAVFMGIYLSTIITSKPPVYSINGGTLSISTQFGQKVNFSDIKNVQLEDSLPKIGQHTNGLGIGTVLKGRFSSNIGNISLYVNTAIPQFIYIETTSGLIIVNDQSDEQTQALFNELNADINTK